MNITNVAPRTIAILSAAFLVLHQARKRRSALIRNFLFRRMLRLRAQRQTTQRAINHIQWTNAFVHVGSCNMAFEGIPRAPGLLPVQLVMNKMWNEHTK